MELENGNQIITMQVVIWSRVPNLWNYIMQVFTQRLKYHVHTPRVCTIRRVQLIHASSKQNKALQ